MSVLEGCYISAFQVFLIFALIILLSQYVIRRHTRLLIGFLSTVALLLFIYSTSYLKKPDNYFAVYNSYNEPDMGYIIDGEKIAMPIDSNKIVAHPSATIVLLTENRFKSKESSQVFPVDYLIVVSENSFSVAEL